MMEMLIWRLALFSLTILFLFLFYVAPRIDLERAKFALLELCVAIFPPTAKDLAELEALENRMEVLLKAAINHGRHPCEFHCHSADCDGQQPSSCGLLESRRSIEAKLPDPLLEEFGRLEKDVRERELREVSRVCTMNWLYDNLHEEAEEEMEKEMEKRREDAELEDWLR
jgi:hypothetical protein